MSNFSHSSREFYENLYQHEDFFNPARDIYNDLRVQTIANLIRDVEGSLLIVGCGSGKDLAMASPSQKIVAFDLSFHAVRKISEERADLLVANALHLPFPDEYFSVLVCSEVLEHIPDIKQAVQEFHRVLKKDGVLVVSSPNWLSWFGLARWAGETFLKRPFHSSDQPYDDWKTLWKYQRELAPEFTVEQARGVWYLPPMHYKGKGLSPSWTKGIYTLFRPLEAFFSKALPFLGHLIVLKCSPSK
ncbi:class I SAM-dependent methyltransferase [Anaerolinea sp.]|uniref:class I SAM-dependent methyltransferase n=1 Tax=Anaerolinea sp. TaxID=1872519 RepID=UPI002ACE5B84|nr:methyltransferase domain-containing protein [Anaerolinea sp.]